MNPTSIVVMHPEAMPAEGIAYALGRNPGLLPVAIATTCAEGEQCCERAYCAAIDARLPDALATAARLRRRGIRVVFIGTDLSEEHGAWVPAHASVADLARALVPNLRPRRRALTPREREILTLVAKGLAGKQVASRLGISPKTVEQHKTRIFAKLGVPNQTAAVCMAMSTDLGA